MSEIVPSEELATPNWRIIIIIGSMGAYGTIDDRRMNALPLEAALNGLVVGNESVGVAAVTNADSHLIDWALCREEDLDALNDAADYTARLQGTLGLTGTEIKEVCMTAVQFSPEPDPNIARDSMTMRDYTGSLELLAELRQMPQSFTVDNFLR